jgi:Tol biopolymer transport system component
VFVFETRREGHPELFGMFADGSALRRIVVGGDGITPAWSPDARRVAFTRGANLMISDLQGRETVVTTHPPGSPTRDIRPTWAPDGGRLAFERTFSQSEDIYVVNADGSGLRPLTTSPAHDNAPSWSPDGSKIAYSTSDGLAIVAVNPEGTGARVLSANFDHDPDWSPDGSKIAFYTLRHAAGTPCCNSEIYVMNADGSGQARLTRNPSLDHSPRWSPDGTQIAFVSTRDGNDEIYVMNADGSGQTNISRHPSSDLNPDWAHTVDLRVSQRVRPAKPRVGQRVTLTVAVRNAGAGAAVDARVQIALRGRARVVSLSGRGARCAARRLQCVIARIPAKPPGAATIALRVVFRRASTATSRATVAATQIESSAANNRSTLRTRVRPKPRR